MLSPDRNEPPTRSRTWMAVAASVAALALVGGLIIAANRDTDDNVPADEPTVTVTVPDTAGVDGETARAPEAVDTADPAVEQATETLPPVELATQGTLSATCGTGAFDDNGDGSITGPQTCLVDGDPLPGAAQTRNSLTIFLSGEGTPDLFVSTGDTGFFNAGYSLPDGSVRYSGFEPGVDEFAGETIYTLGRRPAGGEEIPGISDWTTEPGNTPLPTTEDGGISADVSVTCTTEFASGDDTEQVLDQTCTYTSDDTRFVTAPELVRVRVSPADPAALTLAQGPMFFTAQADSGASTAGISEDGTKIRAVGVRLGTGEFEGQLIHDVMYLTADTASNISGTIRSTVYSAE